MDRTKSYIPVFILLFSACAEQAQTTPPSIGDPRPANEGGLIAEIHYNVRAKDPSWLMDGGTQADGDWITNNCSRFDFIDTETEFRLDNRRTCN